MWLRTARHLGTLFMPNLEFIHDRVTTLRTTDLKLLIYVTLNNYSSYLTENTASPLQGSVG